MYFDLYLGEVHQKDLPKGLEKSYPTCEQLLGAVLNYRK